MKKNSIFKVLSLAVVFAVFFVTCAGETDNNNPDNDNDSSIVSIPDIDLPLPAPIGNNAVSGKEYFVGYEMSGSGWNITYLGLVEKLSFSVTANGAADGTYIISANDNGEYKPSDKFTFNTPIETGTYSWNETLKTVTLKPERIAFQITGGNWATGLDGSVLADRQDDKPIWDKARWRRYLQTIENDANLQEVLLYESQKYSEVFSSVADLANYEANEAFRNRTMDYSFSSDGKMLFLQESLPENIGINELTDQTYTNGMELAGLTFVSGKYSFTSSGYTYTPYSNNTPSSPVKTGSFVYDSNKKWVWTKVETIDGKNKLQYYSTQTVINNHHLSDDDTYRAAVTNGSFRYTSWQHYNSTKKSIGSYSSTR